MSASVDVGGDDLRCPLTRDSSITEVVADPVAGPRMRTALRPLLGDGEDPEALKVIGPFPVGQVASFPASTSSPAISMRSWPPSPSDRAGSGPWLAGLGHLTEDGPGVRDRAHVPELIGVDYGADRLDPAVEHV